MPYDPTAPWNILTPYLGGPKTPPVPPTAPLNISVSPFPLGQGVTAGRMLALPLPANQPPPAAQLLANAQQAQTPAPAVGPYPGAAGNALPPGVTVGGKGWPTGAAHYDVTAPSQAVSDALQCMVTQGPANFVVDSTSGGKHSPSSTDPHYQGNAFDALADPAYRAAIMQAAANCGAVYQQDEYAHPSKDSSGGHLHFQLRPGLKGAAGPYYPENSD